jgi:hypothetical protein
MRFIAEEKAARARRCQRRTRDGAGDGRGSSTGGGLTSRSGPWRRSQQILPDLRRSWLKA